jgi:hypothetical protein
MERRGPTVTDERVQANPDADVEYSLAGGFTVNRGTTVNGVVVNHTPTKEEPFTDVSVTIRTMGAVVIR